jgi:hypothetical protein
MTLVAVAAIVVLAAGAAEAYTLPYYAGDAGFFGYNIGSDPLENPGNAANWNSPTATRGGALWINSGSGPAQVPGGSSINMELFVNDYDASWGSGGANTGGTNGWVEEFNVLVSDGTANGDILSGAPGAIDAASIQLGVPGTFWEKYWEGDDDTNFQFQLYAWTGTATTYAAALLTPGAYAAQALWTQNCSPAYYGPYGEMPQVPPGFTRMPAIVMTPTVAAPEPSTLLLSAAAALGLLAYAWRKRQ